MDIPGEKTTHLVMDKFLTAEEKQNSAEHLTKLEEISAGGCKFTGVKFSK